MSVHNLIDKFHVCRRKKIHNNIEILVISIDAATEKTYNIVRRGGNWKLLLKNLRCRFCRIS